LTDYVVQNALTTAEDALIFIQADVISARMGTISPHHTAAKVRPRYFLQLFSAFLDDLQSSQIQHLKTFLFKSAFTDC